MPVLPRCLAKAAAQAEWMLLTQLSSSTWHGACQYFAHVVTANIIAGERGECRGGRWPRVAGGRVISFNGASTPQLICWESLCSFMQNF